MRHTELYSSKPENKLVQIGFADRRASEFFLVDLSGSCPLVEFVQWDSSYFHLRLFCNYHLRPLALSRESHRLVVFITGF